MQSVWPGILGPKFKPKFIAKKERNHVSLERKEQSFEEIKGWRHSEEAAPCGLLDSDAGFSRSQPEMTGYRFPETRAGFPHLFLKLA